VGKLLTLFKNFWGKEKSLSSLLLILAVHIFVIIPLGQKTLFGNIIFLLFYTSLLLAGLLYLASTKKFTNKIWWVLSAVILVVVSFLVHDAWIELVTDGFFFFYFVFLAWIVLLKVFSNGPITLHRIQGSIVAYLLISLVFATLYHVVFVLKGEAAFKGMIDFDRKEFMYFSLTTITTVGYGDISAAVPGGRSLSNLEALVGQLYPTILIAWLVSKHVEASGKR
jgi:hypothetical protein